MTDASLKTSVYADLADSLTGLLQGEPDFVANLANMSALLYHGLASVNWVGWYLIKGETLVLGPFQGKPACLRIPIGKGVCGSAVARAAPILVHDVHEFPGHIACDSASNAELVIPLALEGRIIGVLDLDSPEIGRFDAEDLAGCAALVRIFIEHQRVWPHEIARLLD
jgi:GAF domain-containing protein